MAKKKPKEPEKKEEDNLDILTPKEKERVEEALLNMRFIDLQRAAVIRGMKFQNVVESGIAELQSFVIKYWNKPVKMELLEDFDKERMKEMKRRGLPDDEPFVRLGFMGKTDEETGEITSMIRPEKVKVKKIKKNRERDKELGIFTGTKKAFTFEMCKKGKSLDKTIEAVMKKFPEAQEKSIKIWYKKATKLFANA